ncbi:transmembrane protein 43 homolog isoform X2 [Nilaparvata lugens]|nr:transmembrane protein 43 homolog isoform X2 [Nilaparvata lugens]
MRRNAGNIIFGTLLLGIGIFLLYSNEMKAVEMTNSLHDALNSVIQVHLLDPIYEINEGMLIYICGPIQLDEPLTEPEYGISVPAVKLKRRVQMYQWVEEITKKAVDDTLPTADSSFSATYTTEWKDKLIDSNRFFNTADHHNPTEFPLKSAMYVSDVVRLGRYTLSTELKDKFSDFISVTSDERPERRDIKLHVGLYYHSIDVWNPEVGDIRVQFSYAGPQGAVVTVVGRQVNSELQGSLLAPGRVPVYMMLSQQHANHTWFTRLFRILAWMLVYLGATFLHHLIKCYNRIGLDENWLSVSMSFCVGLVVTGAVWYSHRPWLGWILFSGAVLPLLWPFVKRLHTDEHYHAL